jgi:hypothetical protein
MISLSLMIFLISAIKIELTHTFDLVSRKMLHVIIHLELTLFANEGVIAVVGVVGIAGLC